MAQDNSENAAGKSVNGPNVVAVDTASVGSVPTKQPAEAPATQKRKGGAGKVGIIVIVLLLGTLAWHVAGDQLAPTSSTG